MLILNYFDLKCHIQIKTEACGNIISGIQGWLTFNNKNQLHIEIFFFKKII